MVLFNYATKEITAKIVYYGPGLCGKTTNLQFIYESLPSNHKSKMLSLSTKTDRTLFFDFLPLDLLKIRELPIVIQYNKRDLPNAMPIAKLNAEVNKFKVPHFESVATTGAGVEG